MADDKKSFVAYADWQGQFNLLSNEEAGILIKHILSYVNDEHPILPDDRILSIAFEPIKQQLKRDLKKYEEKKASFSEAGKQSVLARKLVATQLYVLKFYSEEEEFLKVGITDNSISRRFSSAGDGGFKYGYKFEVIAQFFPKPNCLTVSEIEKIFNKEFKKHSYRPLYKFGGYMECYKLTSLKEILQRLTSLNNVKYCSTFSTVNVNDTVTDTVNVTDTVTVSVIKEDPPPQNFSPSFGKQPISTLKNFCSGYSEWLNIIAKKNNLTKEKVLEWLDAFELHLLGKDKKEETESEFKNYFNSWITAEIRQGRSPTVKPVDDEENEQSAMDIALSVMEEKHGNRINKN